LSALLVTFTSTGNCVIQHKCTVRPDYYDCLLMHITKYTQTQDSRLTLFFSKNSLHAVTSYLGEENINIETLNTDTTHAPFGEDHLFTMEAVIEIGPNVSLSKFKQTMDKLKRRLGVDIVISEHESHRDD
jgi:glycine cleavage system regulatory protein